jgi:hypothetical protein
MTHFLRVYNARAMHRYHVINKIACPNCRNRRIVEDEITAADEESAAAAFKEKHRLCKPCSDRGEESAVTFDTFINLEALPGF